jgi:small conductance mechanosensitive channel
MEQTFKAFWQSHGPGVLIAGEDIVKTVVIILAGIVLSYVLTRFLTRAHEKAQLLEPTIVHLLKMVIRYGVAIICFIMILNVFGVNTASLLAVLGAAGLAVGLALKDMLANIAAGIILMMLRVYKLGEYVEFDSDDFEFAGTVRAINLFTTVLETPDGLCISAPNSSIWEGPVKNYTRNGKRRMEIVVGIAYSDSIDRAFQVMREAAAGEARFLAEPEPQVLVQSLADSSVNIALRAWTNIADYWPVYWEQTRRLKERFDAAGLNIPFPQRDLHIIH